MSDDLSGSYILRHQERHAPDASWADALADKIMAQREEEEAAKDPIQRKKGEAVERVEKGGRVALDIAHGVIESPRQIAGGAVDAVNMLVTDVDLLDEWLESADEDPEAGTARKTISKVYDFIATGSGRIPRPEGEERQEPFQLPTTGEADSVTGGFIRNISRFVVGFAGAGKLTTGIKAVTKGAIVGKAALKGAMADFAIFDGHEGRLSDLLVKVPALQNPITEYLATDMEDSELKGRLKNVIEGGPIGILLDGLVLGVRAIRSHIAAKNAAGLTDDVAAVTAGAEGVEEAATAAPTVRPVSEELDELLGESAFTERAKPRTLEMEPAGPLTPDDLLKDEPLAPRDPGGSPRSVIELQDDLRVASPDEIGQEKASALGALVEGVAKYKGMSPDEYVRDRFQGVVIGGDPAGDSLFARVLRPGKGKVSEHKLAEYIRDVHSTDTDDYLQESLQFLRDRGRRFDAETLGTTQKGRPTRGQPVGVNDKTMLSIDFSNVCPFTKAGKPCAYCYVETPRTLGSTRAKGTLSPVDFEDSMITDMPQDVVEFLNQQGGIRMNAFSDWSKEASGTYDKVMGLAKKRGLEVKAITKKKEFVDKYKGRDGVLINISSDFDTATMARSLGLDPVADADIASALRSQVSNAPTIAEAKAWAAGSDNVAVRYVAINPDDAVAALRNPDINVVTLYHSSVRGEKYLDKVLRKQNPDLFEQLGEERVRKLADSMEPMTPARFEKALPDADLELARKKMCCRGGNCSVCSVCCGNKQDLRRTLNALVNGEPVASVEFDAAGRALVRALNSPNVSDMAHELGHVFRRDLDPEDLMTVEAWAGTKDGDWTRASEEKFATAFERYLGDGVAPTPALEGVFEKFKTWLSEIYGQFRGRDIDVQISEPVREVMDKLVSGRESMFGAGKNAPRVKFQGEEMFVNWRRLNTEDEVKATLQETANAQKSVIDEATGGEVVTHEQTKLDAAHLDAWNVLIEAGAEKGKTLNRAETFALRTLWVSSGKKLYELAREARDRPSVAAQFAYRRHSAIHNTIQKQALTVRREQSRSLNQWAIPAGSDKDLMRAMERMVEFGGGEAVTRDMADRLLLLVDSGDIAKAEQFVRVSTWAKTKHALTSAWYFSLLSGPKTHLRNLASNTAAADLQIAERKAANIIGQILGEENVARGETMQYFLGQIEGAVEALRITGENGRLKATGNVYRSWKTGEQGIGRGKVEMPPAGAFSADRWELDPQSMQGRAADMLDTFMSTTTRALVAADELHSTMGFRAELRAQAHRQATQEVRAGTIENTPEAIKERRIEILSDPDETMRIAAQDHAEYVTFTQPMGKIATNVTKLANCHPFFSPIARAVLPFRRVSANIPKYAFSRSPAALLMRDTFWGEIKKGGAARDLALGRMAVGTSIMLAATDLAISGNVTGDGPADPQQRATLRRTGWMPNSLRIRTGLGEDDYRYFSIRGMEPLAHSFLIPAGIVEILKHVEWGEYDTDIEELGLATVLSIANHATNATYLSGISGAVAALHDHKMYGEGYFRRLASTAVPTGVAQMTQANDPVKREIEGMMDAIRRRVPGLSKDLPISRDAWGRPISYVSGIGGWYDAVSPMYSKEYKPEPIDKELLELEHYVGRPRKNTHFGGELLGVEAPLGAERSSVAVDLSQFPKAFERYVQLQGNGVAYTQLGSPIDPGGKGMLDTLNDLVTGEHTESWAYDQATRDEKVATIDTLRRRFQAAARAQVMQEFPELKYRVMDELRTSRGIFQ